MSVVFAFNHSSFPLAGQLTRGWWLRRTLLQSQIKIQKLRQNDLYKEPWYFTMRNVFSSLETQSSIEKSKRKLERSHYFEVWQTTFFLDFWLLWQGDLSSCHQTAPLSHLFYPKNTACHLCFQQQLRCPHHSQSSFGT